MGIQEAINGHLKDEKQKQETYLEVIKSTQKYDNAIHARFLLWRDQRGKSLGAIARMLNRSSALVSQYINKKYEGNIEELEKDITNLLRREEDLQFVEGPAVFCSTTPSVLIWEVLQWCDKKCKMGVALAPSGTGKTETCKEYKRRNRQTIFVTADLTKRSIGSILGLIAAHIGSTPDRQSNSRLLDRIIEKLKGSRRLLVIDDAHLLKWEAFEVVRKIYDCAGIGVVYVGQEKLYDQMKGASNQAMLFDQIYSRIAIKRDSFLIEKEDVRMIAESFSTTLTNDVVEYLHQKARGKGRFRAMVDVLELAIENHTQFGTPIELSLFQEAEKYLMAQ